MPTSSYLMPNAPHAPRVSVLMPVYNAERYLCKALDSILSQTFTDFELIAINDGSTDRSAEFLDAVADPRLRIIHQENTGIVGALNHGLRQARGELIARMDGDDLCHRERFDLQVNHLDQHPDGIAVGTWLDMCDPYGSPIGEQTPPTDHDTIDAQLLQADGSAMVHATLMMRRDALQTIGGWRDAYNWVEDLDLMLRLAEHGQVANLPKVLYTYRRHTASVCSKNYTLMCERLMLVMQEAYERRGLGQVPTLNELRPELGPGESVATTYRHWACHAMHHGNGPIARRHATQALLRQPMNLKNWKVMRWALAA